MARFCIGDSHARSFSLAVDHVIEYGGLSQHVLGQFGVPSTLQCTAGDRLLFAFGEVDIRVHLVKLAEQRKHSIETVIADVTGRYVKRIRSFCVERDVRGYIIAAPPPICNAPQHIPVLDGISQRVERARAVNDMLAQICAEDLRFIDPWGPFRNQDGSLNAELSDGGVHVSDSFRDVIRDLVVPHFRNAL